MAWRIVKQPNGLYARFSSIVDDFTHMNMTRQEALELCWEVFGSRHAREGTRPTTKPSPKVDRADSNPGRWESDIDLIRIIHGDRIAEERITMDREGTHNDR